MNKTVKQAIANYLDALEKAHGPEVRNNSYVKQREGTDLVIKQGKRRPKLIDLGNLYSLTNMLRASA